MLINRKFRSPLELKLLSVTSFIFLLSIPFHDVPRTPIYGVSLSVFIFFLLFLVKSILLIRNSSMRECFPINPLLVFLIFIGFYSLSFLVNAASIDARGANHVIFYLLVFVVYYLGVLIAVQQIGLLASRYAVLLGLYILGLFGTIEMALFYTHGFEAYASFLNHGMNVGTFVGIFPRMRSLFNEPSHLALYVIGASVFVWTLGLKGKFIVLYILALTFSTSAVFATIVAASVYLIYKSVFSKSPKYIILSILSFACVLVFFPLIVDLPIFYKLVGTLSGEGVTDHVRLNAFLYSLDYIHLSPLIGLGPTFYYTYYDFGLFNLYLQLYIESGILGLISFLVFYLMHIRPIVKSPIYFIAFFAVAIQYVGMNHYYLPGLWLMLAYLWVIKNDQSGMVKK